MDLYPLHSEQPLASGVCDLPVLWLNETWQPLEVDLHNAPLGALYLRLVNAADCRRSVRFEVRYQQWTASQIGRIMATWQSFLFLLPELPRTQLRLEVRCLPEPTLLQSSLRPSDALPGLVLGVCSASAVLHTQTLAPRERALRFLRSSTLLDHLGWMIGCSTSALTLFVDSAALEQRLRLPGEGLPLLGGAAHALAVADEGNIGQLESFAPLAALAKLPLTAESEAVLRAAAPKLLELCRTDLPQLTSEGCFTLAYPLACIANALHQPAWLETALYAVQRRWAVLQRGQTIVQRASVDGSQTWMPNWSRGMAWLLLGTALVALEYSEQRPVLLKNIRAVTPHLLEQQRLDGLWGVFPNQQPEASGSAGIAAGLALCARLGGFEPDYSQEIWAAAARCAVALEPYVDADGCLTQVSQHNPAAEIALQYDQTIRAVWGTGLYATLLWALQNPVA